MEQRVITKRDNGGPPLDDAVKPLDITFGAKFLRLFEPAQYKAFFGGRGSGKSHAVATALVIIAARSTKRIVCARQYQNSLRDSSKELIEIKIRELGLEDQFLILEREIIHKVTQSRFTFIGLDRNPGSTKSLEGADICWVEEAGTINAKSMEILIPTIRKRGSEIWWTWNPEQNDDPVDEFFRGKGDPKFTPPPKSIIVRVGIEDNPWFFQTSMPDAMWHMANGNPARYRHVWLGDYDDSFETKIFSNIVFGRMEILPYMQPRYGMDFGFGSDPSFLVKCYVNNKTRQIYISKTVSGNFPLRDLPSAMETVVANRDVRITGDSSQPGTIDHLNSEGFNMVGSIKGPGSVKAGINWLQGYQIIIDPNCEDMREEARLYSWQVDRRTNKRLNVPVDAHNHGWDALRYACEDAMTEGETPDNTGGVIRSRRN